MEAWRITRSSRFLFCNNEHFRNIDWVWVAHDDRIENNASESLHLAAEVQEVYKKGQKHHHNQQDKERLDKLCEGVYSKGFSFLKG